MKNSANFFLRYSTVCGETGYTDRHERPQPLYGSVQNCMTGLQSISKEFKFRVQPELKLEYCAAAHFTPFFAQ